MIHTFTVFAFLEKDILEIDWLSKHKELFSTDPSDNSFKPVK